MAQNRLNKVASIFTRVNGLLKAGIIPAAEKPLWYDIYQAFPPTRDPTYRSAAGLSPSELPELPQRILYNEDKIRSFYLKEMQPIESQVLSSQIRKPVWEMFIEVHNELRAKGISEANLIEATCEEMKNKGFIVGKKGDKLAAADNLENEEQNNEEFLSILKTALNDIQKKETGQENTETAMAPKE